jgi:adenylosuccinate lyase
MLDPKNFIGRCPEQVMKLCGPDGKVQKALKPYQKHIEKSKEIELTV